MKREIIIQAENTIATRHQKLNEEYEKEKSLLSENEEYSELNSALHKEMIENARREAYGEKIDRKKENKLKANLVQLLKKQNISLTEKFSCAKCKDSGYINGKMCSCLKKEISNILFEESNFGKLVSFESAKKTAPKEYQKLYEKMQEWCHSDFKKNLIYISGMVGVGKTYLTLAIANELIEEGNEVKIDRYLDDNLSKYKDIDNVVLGCTHYPLIKKNIRRVLGDVKFFDGSLGVSKELVRQLELGGIIFDNKSFSVDFIDSSGNVSKEKRFKELMSSSYE